MYYSGRCTDRCGYRIDRLMELQLVIRNYHGKAGGVGRNIVCIGLNRGGSDHTASGISIRWDPGNLPKAAPMPQALRILAAPASEMREYVLRIDRKETL